MDDTEIPSYCIGEVWPKGEEQRELLSYDKDAAQFHIGQRYEDKTALPLKCNKCGSKEFNVAQGSYYTAIRCVRCEWECCIHAG